MTVLKLRIYHRWHIKYIGLIFKNKNKNGDILFKNSMKQKEVHTHRTLSIRNHQKEEKKFELNSFFHFISFSQY